MSLNPPPRQPAFPLSLSEDADHVEGMSLRDYFAGQALAGICGDPARNGTHEGFAYDAYRFADAMMKERENKEESK